MFTLLNKGFLRELRLRALEYRCNRPMKFQSIKNIKVEFFSLYSLFLQFLSLLFIGNADVAVVMKSRLILHNTLVEGSILTLSENIPSWANEMLPRIVLLYYSVFTERFLRIIPCQLIYAEEGNSNFKR